MKEYNIIDTVRLYVMKAQTQKAISELYAFLNETKVPEVLNDLILLSSHYSEIEKSENLGMGRYIEEKNRINLALLKILEELEGDKRIQMHSRKEEGGGDERLDLIESKVDFLLSHVEKNDDILFYGFHNSILWKLLEPKSRENLIQANIIEKEARQDSYKPAINMLVEVVLLEIGHKFLLKFKKEYAPVMEDRKLFMKSFHGMNKHNFYDYLQGKSEMSLHQLSEILLENVLNVDKRNLSEWGGAFFATFYDNFKIKNQGKAVEFFQKYTLFKIAKNVNQFTQTLVDLVDVKEDVINLLLNLQPKNQK
ncbi:MAG: hypothetical protein H6563_09625 [Lewinellaceae bacterium]|nr:hypothetical protein [Lewinellaceae bacterium]